MATVYINNIQPFDATLGNTFTFVYGGGNQAYSNRLTIKDNATFKTVYDKTVTTMLLKHEIPSGTLTNGKDYVVQVQIFDINNKLCATSDNKSFKCLSTPVFRFSNISDGDVVRTSSINAQIEYSQAENELLQGYYLKLYSSNKDVIYSSDVIYDSTEMMHTFNSLEDNTSYYVMATGTTVNGMIVSTGYIQIFVDYINPSAFFLLDLENIPKEGAILVQSNISVLEVRSDKETKYIVGTIVDLTDGNRVIFDEGYSLTNPFSIVCSGRGFERNEVIMSLSDGENSANIEYKIGQYESTGGVDKAFLSLTIQGSVTKYITYSNFIDIPKETDMLVFCILRSGNAFEIRLINLG